MTAGGSVGKLDFLDVAHVGGAQRILRKPFSLRELSHSVHDLLTPEWREYRYTQVQGIP
jgi:hypothetical protein